MSSRQRLWAGMRQGLLLIALGAALGVAHNAIRVEDLPWATVWTPSEVSNQKDEALPGITLENAWRFYQAGRAVFLDARDPIAFQEGHIAGALNVPPEDVDAYVRELRALSDSGMEIISYCDGIGCPLSPELASALKERGIASVRILFDGWRVWQEAGYPVEKE